MKYHYYEKINPEALGYEPEEGTPYYVKRFGFTLPITEYDGHPIEFKETWDGLFKPHKYIGRPMPNYKDWTYLGWEPEDDIRYFTDEAGKEVSNQDLLKHKLGN